MKSRDLSVTNLLFILVVHCSSIDEPLYGGVYPSYQACDTNPTIKRVTASLRNNAQKRIYPTEGNRQHLCRITILSSRPGANYLKGRTSSSLANAAAKIRGLPSWLLVKEERTAKWSLCYPFKHDTAGFEIGVRFPHSSTVAEKRAIDAEIKCRSCQTYAPAEA
ncbi:hypothetical protein HYQ44_011841 [Verticillium longisporum]|nr:hypothetical protein HYQ44_011841 [Verticillium longisporum]